MAVELVSSFQEIINHLGIRETSASAELKSIEEQLLRIFQSHQQHTQTQIDCRDSGVSTSKQAVSRRTGHARFRRGPSSDSSDATTSSSSSQSGESSHNQMKSDSIELKSESKTSDDCKNTNSPISSGSSSITGEEATVSNGKQGLLIAGVTAAPRTFSAGKPPLPSSHRKRLREIEESSRGLSGKHSTSRGGCHCCKRRKRVEIRRVRITNGGSSSSSIPADSYSWKKYDRKLIPGTPLPRGGYYKCSSTEGCPARKHVVRDRNDPTVLIVTYEGEHRHHHRRMTLETLTRLNNTTIAQVFRSK